MARNLLNISVKLDLVPRSIIHPRDGGRWRCSPSSCSGPTGDFTSFTATMMFGVGAGLATYTSVFHRGRPVLDLSRGSVRPGWATEEEATAGVPSGSKETRA